MNNLDLHKPQRQNVVGVIVIFLRNLRRGVNFFLAVVVVQFGGNFKMLGLDLWQWGILLALIFLLISYWQYRKFFFYVKGDNFVVEKGIVRQEKTNVPFARVQTVNTTQNVIQQIFGVVALKIDTAGSAGQEIEISALERDYAQSLEDFLMNQKYANQKATDENSAFEQTKERDKPLSNTEEQATQWRNQEPLVRLSFQDLLKVGFTENHLRSGLILFAIVNGYLWQFEEYLLKPFEPYIEETTNTFLASWLLLLPLGVLAFLIISVISSLVRVVLRYFNLKFYLNQSGIFMQSGLFKRSEYNIPHNKIQYFKWSSNPLRRFIGYQTMRINQAGSQEVGARKTVSIPGLKKRDLVKVLQTFYPQRHQGKRSTFKADILLAQQYFFWMGVLPALAVATLFYFQKFIWLFYLPLAVYLVVVAWLVYRYAQTVQLRVNEAIIELKKGWLFPSQVSIKHYKMQNISYKQSVFQKRKNLASLVLYTAAGAETMPHLPARQALLLYHYLLFKIESSNKGWM